MKIYAQVYKKSYTEEFPYIKKSSKRVKFMFIVTFVEVIFSFSMEIGIMFIAMCLDHNIWIM